MGHILHPRVWSAASHKNEAGTSGGRWPWFMTPGEERKQVEMMGEGGRAEEGGEIREGGREGCVGRRVMWRREGLGGGGGGGLRLVKSE